MRHDLPSWAYFLLLVFSAWSLSGLMTGQWNIHRLLDNSGWIKHNLDTPVWIKGEWLGSEYRVCQMPRLRSLQLLDSAHLICGQADGQSLQYGEDTWAIHFWRQLDRS